MAPREATGMFPDQFLSFEYDAPFGQQPPPPPPQQHADAVQPGAPIPENNPADEMDNNGPAPAAVNALNSDGGTSSGNRPPAVEETNSMFEAVDPLSIDPTTGEEDDSNTPPVVDGGSGIPASRPFSPSVESSGPPIGSSTLIHPRSSRRSSLQNEAGATSPLSTGSSFFTSSSGGGITHNNSRNNTAPNSPMSFNTSSSGTPPPPPRQRRAALPVQSVLDSAASMEDSDDEDEDEEEDDPLLSPPALDTTFGSTTTSFTADHPESSSRRRLRLWQASSSASQPHSILLSDDTEEEKDFEEDDDGDEQQQQHLSDTLSESPSVDSTDSLRMIYRNTAFDGGDADDSNEQHLPPVPPPSSSSPLGVLLQQHPHPHHPHRGEQQQQQQAPPPPPPIPPSSPNSIRLSFGPNTTVADLKYFAERGCIVALLQALTTPRLVTLGTRMLADYAKMSHRRVAVASNKRILEFVQLTMRQVNSNGSITGTTTEPPAHPPASADWLGREYAVETVRSLTATEESDRFLMRSPGLLPTLALVARGGPFLTQVEDSGVRCTLPLASEKAKLHACIAIMNLSCGKANKIEIAKIPDVLEAMRDVMLGHSAEARLKATTCIKNLSNADANDGALLGTPGLLEALGHVASVTCLPEAGATPCTTNACLALMNLSISKANKHRVFRTPGVMDALMTVLERTTAQGPSTEARIKACSALSNLAIGYDNKIPMFNYPGFVESILNVIQTDTGEARTKACSILWSFAAEMKNQVPVVQRGDILPVLVSVADEDGTTEARFKCVAALTLLAESLDNSLPLLESGALAPLMQILHEAGPDPTQWKGQTASWCVGFLMNIAQSDEAVPALREAGVVELLAPLLTLDHYQSLKAAMAVTFCCRYDEGDECYDLLRKTENVIPKIISLLHNTLSGRGGNGYKYGVFTLRSSVGCIDALASGPDFMKERIATGPVFESLLRVVHDFCVDGGTPGAIVGGGRDDILSATLAVRALQSLTAHLIPIAGSSALPFGKSFEDRLLTALESFESCTHSAEIKDSTRELATDAKTRILGGRKAARSLGDTCHLVQDTDDVDMGDVASFASNCCGFHTLPVFGEDFLHALAIPSLHMDSSRAIVTTPSIVEKESTEEEPPIRTFLLTDSKTGRRFVVPSDPTGGRKFNDTRVWCYRRGRFCLPGEEADPNYRWSAEMQQAYEAALANKQDGNVSSSDSSAGGMGGGSSQGSLI